MLAHTSRASGAVRQIPLPRAVHPSESYYLIGSSHNQLELQLTVGAFIYPLLNDMDIKSCLHPIQASITLYPPLQTLCTPLLRSLPHQLSVEDLTQSYGLLLHSF